MRSRFLQNRTKLNCLQPSLDNWVIDDFHYYLCCILNIPNIKRVFWKLPLDQGEGELFISFFMLRVFNFREKKNGTSTHGVYKVYDSMEDELQNHPQETTLVLHSDACSGDYTGDLLRYCLACVLRCSVVFDSVASCLPGSSIHGMF